MTRKRTNIEIDMDLVEAIKARFAIRTTTEAVDLALRNLAPLPMSREEALAMEGAHLVGEVPSERLPPHVEEEAEGQKTEGEQTEQREEG